MSNAREYRRLHHGWVQLLDRYPWDWYCTLSFDHKKISMPGGFVSQERALKLFRVMTNRMSRGIDGKRWYPKSEGVYYAVALENHQSGILHIHALLGHNKNLNRETSVRIWQKDWFNRCGHAKFEIPRNDDRVQYYVTKAVASGGTVKFSDNLSKIPTKREWARKRKRLAKR